MPKELYSLTKVHHLRNPGNLVPHRLFESYNFTGDIALFGYQRCNPQINRMFKVWGVDSFHRCFVLDRDFFL